MKARVFKVLLSIETIIIVLEVLWFCFAFITNRKTELLREASPNGDYLLVIQELGTPGWPFGKDHLRISLYEKKSAHFYRVSLDADVSNDGGRASFEVEWLEDGVQIILKGSEQPDAYYILPFKTLED